MCINILNQYLQLISRLGEETFSLRLSWLTSLHCAVLSHFLFSDQSGFRNYSKRLHLCSSNSIIPGISQERETSRADGHRRSPPPPSSESLLGRWISPLEPWGLGKPPWSVCLHWPLGVSLASQEKATSVRQDSDARMPLPRFNTALPRSGFSSLFSGASGMSTSTIKMEKHMAVYPSNRSPETTPASRFCQ